MTGATILTSTYPCRFVSYAAIPRLMTCASNLPPSPHRRDQPLRPVTIIVTLTRRTKSWGGQSSPHDLATRNGLPARVGLAYLILPVWPPRSIVAAIMVSLSSQSCSSTIVGISPSPTQSHLRTSLYVSERSNRYTERFYRAGTTLAPLSWVPLSHVSSTRVFRRSRNCAHWMCKTPWSSTTNSRTYLRTTSSRSCPSTLYDL